TRRSSDLVPAGETPALHSDRAVQAPFISVRPDYDAAMRVLVVEDAPDMARFITRGLGEQSYAVDAVCSDEAAIEQATTAPYDAVVLDGVRSLLQPDRGRHRTAAADRRPRPDSAHTIR